MTIRFLATLAIVTAALAATAASGAHAQAGAPAPAPAQSPAQSPPPTQPSSPGPAQSPAPSGDTIYSPGQTRVAPPRVVREVKPGYTAEAVRNRIQGRVRLQ